MRLSSLLTTALAVATASAHPGEDVEKERAVRRQFLAGVSGRLTLPVWLAGLGLLAAGSVGLWWGWHRYAVRYAESEAVRRILKCAAFIHGARQSGSTSAILAS